MQNNKLGCLSGSGIFAGLLTVVILIVTGLTGGGQIFSAGALNAQPGEPLGGVTSHAEISECSACHVPFWSSERMSDRCLTCHQTVALQMFNPQSLHGAVMAQNPGAQCRACHPEHRGAAALLTRFDTASFPHEALGFSLAGHQTNVLQKPFACKDCHREGYDFSVSTCDECHRLINADFMTAHVNQFGAECLACHDGVDRFGKNFDHAAFFALEGKHAQAECSACHLDPRAPMDFKLASSDCVSCHQKDDKHEGRFGTACGVCHSPDGWKPAKFNHDLAAFKLEGKHVDVACEQCHVNNVFKGTPMACVSCHQKDDKHQGRFGTACEACHTPASWEGATFDHNLAAFRLDGAHARVACERCHINNIFKGTPTTCAACHADPTFHVGAFGSNCASCHSTAAWSPAGFNLPHPEPRTDEGGSGIHHGGATCRTCHPGSVFVATCDACHKNGFEGKEGDKKDDD